LNTKNSVSIPVGHQIKASKIRCIDQDGNNLGIIEKNDGLRMAHAASLDLVQISKENDVPMCKIVDFGKYKYELAKKQKENDRKKRENEVKLKEIKLKPTTAENDLKIKASKVNEFLAENDHVKVSVVYKGREISYKENGLTLVDTFMSFVENYEYLSEPMFAGNFLSFTLKRAK